MTDNCQSIGIDKIKIESIKLEYDKLDMFTIVPLLASTITIGNSIISWIYISGGGATDSHVASKSTTAKNLKCCCLKLYENNL